MHNFILHLQFPLQQMVPDGQPLLEAGDGLPLLLHGDTLSLGLHLVGAAVHLTAEQVQRLVPGLHLLHGRRHTPRRGPRRQARQLVLLPGAQVRRRGHRVLEEGLVAVTSGDSDRGGNIEIQRQLIK